MNDWEAIGGEEAVRGHVHAFVHRMADDWVIGFLFHGRNLDHIVKHEVEQASLHLGGDLVYRGEPLARIHRALRINAGQFLRRIAIVRMVLLERGVPEDVVERWIAHEKRLESVIVTGPSCTPPEFASSEPPPSER